ncbi:DUF2244 domain-containing protein [Alloyangia pacifica]|uniref:Uncharacterized membrane protein n=1 Tax=Alloyangia pacifica TaxID=311180 RepID=A0A1I6RS94_9RHOB|nr:DUF2244 domain-containing protein [Alloyangia pacifica]SDG58096.1 Uncharacterized membrane protein [Alloyangia pacifica]SFS67506.1 Uncharacterized membrane protein [Alloyangia pacifica]
MPYTWKTVTKDQAAELTLWPHQSLSAKGFVTFIGIFFFMALIPFYGLLGTHLLWGLLPFMLAALWGIWYALRRNERDRQIVEVLTLSPDTTHLLRQNPRGPAQDWQCNTYWVTAQMHEAGGPVPYYVTLKGAGREVEIGAFLSEEERKTLYLELSDRLRLLARP